MPGMLGSPKAWDSHSATVLTSKTGMTQSKYDACVFYKIDDNFDKKLGRHIDDF